MTAVRQEDHKRQKTARAPRACQVPDGRLVLGPRHIAWMLGVGTGWIYINIDRLMAEQGFPAPIARTGQRRWSRRLVEAWVERTSATPSTASADTPIEDDLDAILSSRLQKITEGAPRR